MGADYSKANAVTGKTVPGTHISQARRRRVVFVDCTLTLASSVLRKLHEVALLHLFVSWSQSNLVCGLVFCEIMSSKRTTRPSCECQASVQMLEAAILFSPPTPFSWVSGLITLWVEIML